MAFNNDSTFHTSDDTGRDYPPDYRPKVCVRVERWETVENVLPDGSVFAAVCLQDYCECMDERELLHWGEEITPWPPYRTGGDCPQNGGEADEVVENDSDDVLSRFPAGTMSSNCYWQKLTRLCKCQVKCVDQGFGEQDEDPDNKKRCTCKPEDFAVGPTSGEYFCAIKQNIGKDWDPDWDSCDCILGWGDNLSPRNDNYDPNTHVGSAEELAQELMDEMKFFPPCKICINHLQLTANPDAGGTGFKLIAQSDKVRSHPGSGTGSPPVVRNHQKDREERLKARISKRDAMAHWQSSRTLNADGDWVPSEPTTTPSTTTPITVPPPKEDCCVLLNINAYMFELVPLDQGNRLSTKWKALGRANHVVKKFCLTEQQKIEGVEIEIDPMVMDNRPNPPLMGIPGVDTIRWKKEKFRIYCEKGEYPNRKNRPNYQFQCGVGDFGQPGSGRRKLWIFKAYWKDCGEPCEQDPTKCECTNDNLKSINVDISLAKMQDDFASIPIIGNIVGAVSEIVGETGTDNFLQQVLAEINKGGVPQFSCACKPGRTKKLAAPDVPSDSLIDLIPLMRTGQAIEAIQDILESGDMPHNSQKHMCPGNGQGGSQGMSAGGNERKPYVVLRIRRSNQGADYFNVRRTGKAGDNNDPHSESRPVSGMQNPRWGGEQKRNYALWLAENGVMYRHTHDIYISTGTGAAMRYWKV